MLGALAVCRLTFNRPREVAEMRPVDETVEQSIAKRGCANKRQIELA